MNKVIYEFDDNYYLSVDKLKNEDLKEWIIINSIDYSYNELMNERDEFISNDDYDYNYNYEYDDIDVLRSEHYEFYEDIHKIIKIIEDRDYIELEEDTEEYNEFIQKYKEDIIKCEVKGVF